MRSFPGFLIACAILSLNLFSFINASPRSYPNALEPRKGVRVSGFRSSGTHDDTSSDDTSSDHTSSDTSASTTGTTTGSTGTGSGSSMSSPRYFLYSGTGSPGLLRSGCTFGTDGKCYGTDSATGNGMTCNGAGTWYTVTAGNISAACAQFNYTSSVYGQGQNWTQTTTNAGGPLVNATGGPMTISWTAQFDAAQNGTLAACEGALGDLVTACAGTNGSSQGGLFYFPSSSAAYGVYFN